MLFGKIEMGFLFMRCNRQKYKLCCLEWSSPSGTVNIRIAGQL